MLDPTATVVVVGAGQAGGRAALTLRASGFAGRVLLIGAEAHPPYERPILSKQFLSNLACPPKFLAAEGAYERQGVELWLNARVTGVDRAAQRIELASGESLGYDRLLLATGSEVRRIAIPGWPDNDIHYLRDIDDALRLRARLRQETRMVVVGGGFIGLEVAATAAGLGVKVAVIEAAPALIGRMGCPEASAESLAHLRSLGVDVRLGEVVEGAENGRLRLRSGTALDADFVVAGVGVSPAATLAAKAGLATDDGILTDERGRTSDPMIYAAGDATRHFRPTLGRRVRLESWQNANSQAEVAARNLIGLDAVHDETPWMWSDQGALNIQAAGVPADVDRVVARRDDNPAEGVSLFQFNNGRLVGGVTLNRGRDMAVIRKLLARPNAVRDPDAFAEAATPLRRFLKEA